MIALAVSVFVSAFLGSVHCAGMCGGLACFVAGTGSVRATVAYNAARLASYALLGAIAGAAGAGLDSAGALAGWSRPAAVAAGTLMIVWGARSVLAARGVRVPTLASTGIGRNALAAALRSVAHRTPAERGFVLGCLTPLLPCGWLYAFVAAASATASPVRGAALMAVFWAGGLPMMAALGLGLQRALGPARERLPGITAVAMIVIGLMTVAGRFTAGSAHDSGAHSPAAVHMPAAQMPAARSPSAADSAAATDFPAAAPTMDHAQPGH